jgi:hypothetical protein
MKLFLLKTTRYVLNIFIFYILYFTVYFYSDPYYDFHFIKNYKNMSWRYDNLSLSDISTKKILDRIQKKKLVPSSFIFGSSRSTSISAKYLSMELDKFFYHFGGWNESIGGIARKVELLNNEGVKIENIIICIDADFTFSKNGNPLNNDHFKINRKNKYTYFKDHFLEFVPPKLNKAKLLMLWNLENVKSTHIISDSLHNDLTIKLFDSIYRRTFKHKFTYFPGNQGNGVIQISDMVKRYLQLIQTIALSHETNVIFVLMPIKDGHSLCNEDLNSIKSFFPKCRIIDFSGNNSITTVGNNYPDGKHFKPEFGKLIADSLISIF